MNRKLINDDTIAAIITPVGYGGICVIRISGNKAVNILHKMFRSNKKQFKTHTVIYGHIVDGKEKVIDEVLVTVMLAPKSYTKEDVVEISCHGGVKSVQAILQNAILCGCRLAEPGEFTKRAFLNGRIDLAQAEAVVDIINAKTENSRIAAVSQLKGNLSAKIKEFRQQLLLLLAQIEASIDYPEHDMEQINLKQTYEKCEIIIEEINCLLANCEKGIIMKEGVKTAIIGKPNVGKSSLLNAIVEQERAIVTDIAGTTRDILSEYINIQGVPFITLDTAGIRETENFIEKIGVSKAKEAAQNADLILLVVDGSKPLHNSDIELLNTFKHKKTIVVINKTDLCQEISINELYNYVNKEYIIHLSAKQNKGISKLLNLMVSLVFGGQVVLNDEIQITSLRHKEALFNAKASLLSAKESIENGLFEDIVSIDLQCCYKYLGEIIGETIDDDIVDKIFKEFCLGK